jgi:hypothetical protein
MAGPADDTAKMDGFLKDVSAQQKKDSVWTKEKQIERLTKPASKYYNLNPYEVSVASCFFVEGFTNYLSVGCACK